MTGGLRALAVAVLTATGACDGRPIDAVGADPCVADPSLPACTPLVWPNPSSAANSSPWLVDHHDQLSELRPQVMVLHFFNANTAEDTRRLAEQQIAALREGSRYHGYDNPDAPAFLSYQIVRIVDLADHPPPAGWTYPSSTSYPVDADGRFDHLPLFSAAWADRYQIADPADASRFLTLCELFERGIINELWLEAGEEGGRAPLLMAERKQLYDADNRPRPGMFIERAGNEPLPGVDCAVSVRIAHLSPVRIGPACDLQVRAFGMQAMSRALPALAPGARAFMNADFGARYGTSFDSWGELCDMAQTPCVSYPSPSVATGRDPDDDTTWVMDPFIQGCGTPQFPPNARFRWDYANTAPVNSRCEHFGLRDGPGGADRVEPYTAEKGRRYDPLAGTDCGGGWEIYWRQSIPGYGNTGRAEDGKLLRNWWPYLFY